MNAQDWKPEGYNTHVGDCMPLYHDGIFHLYYLFDRRGHESKWGLGAHQWGHISSNDLAHWNEHPLAINIDRQEEGSICTGSIVVHDGIFYAFYAVRMCDGSPAQLTWATSKDGINFTKINEKFMLSAPYHSASARDPKVFKDEENLYHMLITTSIATESGNKGCLAQVISQDLLNWEQADPIVVLNIEDQPECSDYFEKNGFYYLIYSNFGVAHYFISKKSFGPWTKPENNVIVNESYRVPKRAFWKDGRIIFAGFYIDKGVNFGGTVHFYEAKQQSDGTFEFIDVPEMGD
jgi:sucrose-6-phosphate hydrolase SacC (GH32 family)